MQAVVFDFDGTIVDSLSAVIKVCEDLMRRPKRFTPEEIEELKHKDPLQIALELNIPKWKIPWLLMKGRRMFRNHMRSIDIHDGMPDIIKSLHEAGVPLYVLSSNSKANVQRYLQWHGLDGYFKDIYGGAGVLGKSRKLFALFKKEKLEPSECWYVGDETRDITAAHLVGMKIVSVSWGYNSRLALADKDPDVLVDTPAELKRALSAARK